MLQLPTLVDIRFTQQREQARTARISEVQADLGFKQHLPCRWWTTLVGDSCVMSCLRRGIWPSPWPCSVCKWQSAGRYCCYRETKHRCPPTTTQAKDASKWTLASTRRTRHSRKQSRNERPTLLRMSASAVAKRSLRTACWVLAATTFLYWDLAHTHLCDLPCATGCSRGWSWPPCWRQLACFLNWY